MNILFCVYCWSWGTIWTAIAAVATVALFVTAYIQLNKSREIASAQFIANYNKDFFNQYTTEILTMFEFGFMEYHHENNDVLMGLPKDFSYFKVTMNGYLRKEDHIPAYLDKHRNIYACYEIDNYVLNCFEDMGILESKGFLDINIINESFGYYITLIYKNPSIIKYIEKAREENNDNTLYIRFEELAKKIKI